MAGIKKTKLVSKLALPLVTLLLFLSYGCAKPPKKEMADAEAAVTAAKLAEADIYAPGDYQSAEDMLAQAKAEMDKREYKSAKESAIQTINLATNAKEQAVKAKQDAKVRAQNIIKDVKGALDEAKAARALTYNANKYNNILSSLKGLEADYNAEKYLDVIAKGNKLLAQAKDLAASCRLAAAESERRKREESERLARIRAEEERRRAEDEARRRAEAERSRDQRGRQATSHVVSRGECLWVISENKNIYDNPFQWPLIYKANRSQINDPDLIFPGQDFTIPRNSSGNEVKDALYMAKNRGPWSLHDGK